MPFVDPFAAHEPDHYDIDTEPDYTEEEWEHSLYGEPGAGPAQSDDETGNEAPLPWPEGYEPGEDLPF